MSLGLSVSRSLGLSVSKIIIYTLCAVYLLYGAELYSQNDCMNMPSPEGSPCNEPWSVDLLNHTVTIVIPNTTPPCTLTYRIFYKRRCDEFSILDWAGGWSECAQNYINSFGNLTPPKSAYDVSRELKQLVIAEFMRQMSLQKYGPADYAHKCADGNYRRGFSAYESLCQNLVWTFKKIDATGTGNEWVTISTTGPNALPLSSSWATIIARVNANNGDISTLTIGYGGNCGSGCCRKEFLICWDHISGAWNVIDAGAEIYPAGTVCPFIFDPNNPLNIENCFNSCTTQ